ncbi:MAG: hypothetical protein KAJ19_16850, partial [Gammaproteobacteria bacterium]|nr:hypothetical protein [Gammaproteobacteria bacterium]
KAMKPGRALPDITPLIEKGLDQDSAGMLVRLVIDNKGDVKKAVSEFKEMIADGNLDAFKTGFWMIESQGKQLRGFEIYDEFMDVISNATTREEALKSVNKVFDDVVTDSARVADEVPRMSEMAEGVQVVDAMVDAGVDVSQDLMGHATSLFEANSQAIYYMERLIQDILSSATARADPETVKKLQVLRDKYRNIFDGSTHAAASAQQSKWTGAAGEWKKKFEIAKGKDTPVAQLRAWWNQIGIPGEAPTDLTLSQLWSSMWEDWFFPKSRVHWRDTRDMLYGTSENIVKEIGELVPFDDVMTKSLDEPRRLQRAAVKWDEFLEDGEVILAVDRAIKRNDKASVARIYAKQFLLSDTDDALLDIINNNITEGMYVKLSDVPPDVSFNAFIRHATGEAPEAAAKVAGEVAEAAVEAPKKFVPAPKPAVSPYAGGTPSMARAVEQQTPGLRDLQKQLLQGVDDNWGRVVPQEWSDELEKAVNVWEKGATKGVGEARLIAVDVANAARDFTMLSYPQKKYFDLLLAYIYPYHFWYNRTYSNWMKRIATNPEVIAGFAKYQDMLAKIHAGAPEWWKYNINSNEVLGIDSDNPLFFNLMSTLNPMQGLTGVDFTDNKKRINWWTSFLDDLNKFGPSTWTPYSIATAAYLYHQGEEEAASRWGGRLFPQTAAIKSATSLLNLGPPGGYELDPSVGFFSGGMDPYERRQVGRALYGLQAEGSIDAASAIDAAYLQEGDVWDMAKESRSRSRSWGQLASFMFGTGFKARSGEDMEIDRFDAEYFNLWSLEDNMSPEEFQQQMDEMRKDYPFMDAVLLSRKGGLARDRGLVYNVLGRIPPGQRDEIAEAAGLDYDFINKFYEDKGHIEDWEETDRQRLMAWAVDVGAILDMPDNATKDVWKMVTGRYSQMMEHQKEYFGEDVQAGIDRFWVIRRDEGDEASYAFLEANPIVEQAMTWKDATYINDPLMG